jgi:TPR repeat protein
MARRLIPAAAAAAVVGTSALAGPVDDGIEAARSGDYPTALRLLSPPAQAGDPRAQFMLGLSYANGRGVAKDAEKAAEWYRLAAEQGLPEAQNNLGALYSAGDGVPHDHAEAMRWWARAAAQGFARSQTNVAQLLSEGGDIPLDYVQAYKWATLAAAQGEVEAAEVRERVAKLMTPEQIAEANRLAADWRPVIDQRI